MAGGSFGGGSGTLEDPYLVEDGADLNAVRNNLTAHYRQVAHVSLSAYESWVPIGDNFSPFFGSYDGGGFDVRDLRIDDEGLEYGGLFGLVVSAHFIRGVRIPNADAVVEHGGLLAGLAFKPDWTQLPIEDCHVSGIIRGKEGQQFGVGGLLGGGVVHLVQCGGDVTVEGNGDYSGGLLGSASGSSLTRCYAIGPVSGKRYVGSLFALANAAEDCYALGSVTGDDWVGGLGGLMSDFGPHGVTRCFSSGAVSLTEASEIEQVGGLLGDVPFGFPVIASYYDSTTSGQSDEDGRGVPKTTAQMQQQTTFEGWDFADVWAMPKVRAGYPFLQWAPPPSPVSGRVIRSQLGVVGAEIVAVNIEDDRVFTAVTGEGGAYEMDVPPGTYLMMARFQDGTTLINSLSNPYVRVEP